MVKIKRKEKGVNFKTVTGENVKLISDRREQHTIKITLVNSNNLSFLKRTIILLIVASFNLLSLLLEILNVQIVIAIFFLTLLELYRLCGIIKEESLTGVKHLGFQLTTKYTIGKKTKFIPWEQVQTVFINEIIFKHKIIYVLNLITKDIDDTKKLVPLFFDTLPRLECLKVIYKDLKDLQPLKVKTL